MKILVIAPTPFFSDRGTHIRILEEALALERRGHEVKIATYHIGRDLPQELDTRIDIRRIRRLLFWYHKLEAGPDWQKIILDLLLIKKTFFLARTWKPDVMHGHLHEGVLVGWIVQKIMFWKRVPLVADFHGSLTREMVSHAYLRGGWLRKVFRFVEERIDGLGDRAVASSWANAEEISRIRGEHVSVLLDGARLFPNPSLERRAMLRERYDIPMDRVVATYTGAFVANKGIGTLIEAIASAVGRNDRLHFVLAGFPRNELEPFLVGQSWTGRVTVISPLPYFTLGEILELSDVGIDPKHDDTGQASGKMLNYMGAGLPVACFDTQNNREYLSDGGQYAKEASPQALADAIVRLSLDEGLRQRKGSASRLRAEAFGWDKTGETLEEIYKTLI